MNINAIRTLPGGLRAIRRVYATFRNQPWWRGQGTDWPLVPSVHRHTTRGAVYESNIAIKFAQRAPTRHPKCPARGDLPAWLFLMQHYRLPTRLLDWTESPLYALFFAVADDAHLHEDGVLWALDPFAMNGVFHREEAILQPGHDKAKTLLDLAFSGKPASTDEVAALVTEEIDVRMMVQLSGLTVHGSPKPLESYPAASGYLMRYSIPAAAKPELLTSLKRLGIRSRNLFPDLEHLAVDLTDDSYPS